jgi:prevent-host-death family protein
MSEKEASVSAFEAKTRFAELVRQTESGRSFIILRRGKEVARLIPSRKDTQNFPPKDVASAFEIIRLRVKGSLDVRSLIKECRKL